MLDQEKVNSESKLIINPEGGNAKTKFTSSIRPIRHANSFLRVLNESKGPELSSKKSTSGNLLEYISCCTRFC